MRATGVLAERNVYTALQELYALLNQPDIIPQSEHFEGVLKEEQTYFKKILKEEREYFKKILAENKPKKARKINE